MWNFQKQGELKGPARNCGSPPSFPTWILYKFYKYRAINEVFCKLSINNMSQECIIRAGSELEPSKPWICILSRLTRGITAFKQFFRTDHLIYTLMHRMQLRIEISETRRVYRTGPILGGCPVLPLMDFLNFLQISVRVSSTKCILKCP